MGHFSFVACFFKCKFSDSRFVSFANRTANDISSICCRGDFDIFIFLSQTSELRHSALSD